MELLKKIRTIVEHWSVVCCRNTQGSEKSYKDNLSSTGRQKHKLTLFRTNHPFTHIPCLFSIISKHQWRAGGLFKVHLV
jgi:hypothetical protein